MSAEEFVKLIKASNQHKTLYHFTDEANFPSIVKNGILSKQLLRAKGLWPPAAAGGNELSWQLDQKRGIDGYVSLCMTRNHGMKYTAHKDGRLPNPRYLTINPDILLTSGTRIALGVANGNDVEILSVADAVSRLDVEVLYKRTNWSDPAVQSRLRAAEKYEVLIPDVVPYKLITGYF